MAKQYSIRDRSEAQVKAKTAPKAPPGARRFPTGDEPVTDLIQRNVERYVRREKARKAVEWLPIHIPDDPSKPFGIAWFGDPHVDDEDCNWPLLVRDIELARTTPGVYGACVGDYTNNWVGRLTRLYADQSTNKRDARRLAAWFLKECGVDWRLALLGNHDLWQEGDAILGLIADNAMYLAAWEAKVKFVCGKNEWKVHTAHSFKGQSIHNPTHGLARAARFSGAPADLYVAGHTHTTASQSFEIGGRYVRTALVAGYKGYDMHAVVNGFQQAQSGAAALTIFNPRAKSSAGRVMVFEDLTAGCEILTSLRRTAK